MMSRQQVVTSIDEARKNQLASPSKEGKARAKFKFKGETQNELSFSKVRFMSLRMCEMYSHTSSFDC